MFVDKYELSIIIFSLIFVFSELFLTKSIDKTILTVERYVNRGLQLEHYVNLFMKQVKMKQRLQ